MKKLFLLLAVASVGFVACNNDSTADAAEQAKLDSIRNDSIQKAQADSLAAAAAAQAATDTLPKTDTTPKP